MADGHAAGVEPAVLDQPTRWSRIAVASGDDPAARAALAWLFRAYWEPLRIRALHAGWRDAEDVVQDFWVALLERKALATADPARGRFRTWLLTCLDHHLIDRAAARMAAKRGGDKQIASLPAEDLFADPAPTDPSRAFDRAWAATLLQRAHNRLEDANSGPALTRFRVLADFLTHNGDAAAYAAAGAALGLGEGAVKVAVHRLRAAFRTAVRAEIAETLVDPTPAAIDAELADLCAALAP